MEMVGIGFLIGIFTAIIFVGIGVCFDKFTKGEFDGDSDVVIYVPSRDRNRGSNNRCDISDEGLAAILRAIVYTGALADDTERRYVLEAADRLEKGEDDE